MARSPNSRRSNSCETSGLKLPIYSFEGINFRGDYILVMLDFTTFQAIYVKKVFSSL